MRCVSMLMCVVMNVAERTWSGSPRPKLRTIGTNNFISSSFEPICLVLLVLSGKMALEQMFHAFMQFRSPLIDDFVVLWRVFQLFLFFLFAFLTREQQEKTK